MSATGVARAQHELRRRAVIVGAARDCARHLPRVLANLDRITALYDETFFVFAVSDLTDDTLAQLQVGLAHAAA